MSKKILFAFLGLVVLSALAITSYLAFNDESSRQNERGIIITPKSAKAFLTDPDIERWAVVVGISDYKNNPAVTDLKYADRDAQSFYDFLVSPQGGCFKTENIQLLLNQKATVSNLRYALGTFLGKTADKDLVVIYMAGHGAPDTKKSKNIYFLTYEADTNSLPNTAYPMWEMETALQRFIKAKKVIVVTDACHSAAVSGGMTAMRGNEGYRVNEYLKKLAESREGCTFITASRAGEGSQESEKWGGGHGVFTHFLLEGLKGKADRNDDGFITMKEAYDYLYSRVQRESENGQSPFALAYLDNSIPMGICEPEKLGIVSRAESIKTVEVDYDPFKVDEATAYYNNGLDYFTSGDYEKAIEFLKKSILINPNDGHAYLYLGDAYEAIKDHQKAIESYRQVIRIAPNGASAYRKLGFVYVGIKDYQKAIESFKEGVRVEPFDVAEAHYVLGRAYFSSSDYQKAIELYKEAIRINPDYAEAYCNLGVTYNNIENYQKAIESLKEAIRIAIRTINLDYADAHYNLGIAYLRIGDRGSALDEYNILKGLDKELANELFNLIYGK